MLNTDLTDYADFADFNSFNLQKSKKIRAICVIPLIRVQIVVLSLRRLAFCACDNLGYLRAYQFSTSAMSSALSP